jgi:hypothetical protein
MKIIVTILAGVLLLISCEQQTDIAKNNNDSLLSVDNIKVVDGRLVFSNYTHFNNTIDYIFKNQDLAEGFESRFKGFTSNRLAFKSIDSSLIATLDNDFSKIKDYAFIQEIEGEKNLERVIDLPLLTYVFNEKGILQIGDSIFKFTYANTYKFHSNRMEDFSEKKTMNDLEGVSVYPNIRKKYKIEPFPSETKASLDEVSVYYTSKKFLKAEINENNTVIHVAVTVDTKSRRKVLGIGIAYQVYELYVAGEGWIGYNYPPNPDLYGPQFKSVSDYKLNGSDVQETLEWGAGTPGAFPAPYLISGSGTHWLRESSGSSQINATTSYN